MNMLFECFRTLDTKSAMAIFSLSLRFGFFFYSRNSAYNACICSSKVYKQLFSLKSLIPQISVSKTNDSSSMSSRVISNRLMPSYLSSIKIGNAINTFFSLSFLFLLTTERAHYFIFSVNIGNYKVNLGIRKFDNDYQIKKDSHYR